MHMTKRLLHKHVRIELQSVTKVSEKSDTGTPQNTKTRCPARSKKTEEQKNLVKVLVRQLVGENGLDIMLKLTGCAGRIHGARGPDSARVPDVADLWTT